MMMVMMMVTMKSGNQDRNKTLEVRKESDWEHIGNSFST